MRFPLCLQDVSKMRSERKLFLLLFFALFLMAGGGAQAGATPLVIRDTEIETKLKTWITPLVRAADLSPEQINIILVQDPSVNAFVAGGANIFLYTGLFMKADSPGEIVGVIAHELGHIRGGHLVRLRGAMERASFESILGMLLGVGAAIATGDGGAAAAVSISTQSMATRRFLSFSRTQEASADQAAVSFLSKAGLPADGLISFMKKLEDEELLPPSQQSAYTRTHPITRERVEALSAAAAAMPDPRPWPETWEEDFARIKAKLTGYLTPERVAWDYGTGDPSVPALYARAIAAYRMNKTEDALRLIDTLRAREPANPFFEELQAQVLMDFGRLEEAVPRYKSALNALPDSGLIRIAYGHALIESAAGNAREKEALLREAVKQLKTARRQEPRNSYANRLLATAYGRLGQDDLAHLYLAEESFLKGRYADARRRAEGLTDRFPEGSAERLQLEDLLRLLETVNASSKDSRRNLSPSAE